MLVGRWCCVRDSGGEQLHRGQYLGRSYSPTAVALDGRGGRFCKRCLWVHEIPSGCASYNCVNILDSVNYAEGIAVDGRGNVFVTDGKAIVESDYGTRRPELCDADTGWIGGYDGRSADGDGSEHRQRAIDLPAVRSRQPAWDAVLPSLHITDCTELDGFSSCGRRRFLHPRHRVPTRAVGLVNGHVNVVDNTLNTASTTQTIGVQGTGYALQSQTISFPNPGTQTYGVAPIASPHRRRLGFR